MDKSIILIGACLENVELCQLCDFEIVGIIDNNIKDNYYNIPILGSDNDIEKLALKYSKTTKLSITVDKPITRKKLADYYCNYGFKFTNIISPTATISKSATIGQGVIVQSNVNIASNTKICDFANLNTNANIMHDCLINDYVTIAPSAVVLGHVIISKYVYVGANSTVLPYTSIESNAVIGAGAVVTKNIAESDIVIGVPAKSMIKNNNML